MSKERKKFKDTAIGKFIANNVPDALEALDGIPAVGAIKGVLKLAGVNFPKEKQDEFDAALAEYEKDMFALEVQDRDSARRREIEVNTNENASWLTQNTASLIAIAYTLFNFVIYVMILLGHMKVTNEMAVLIVNSITNIAMLIVGYYYGSSERKSKEFKIR